MQRFFFAVALVTAFSLGQKAFAQAPNHGLDRHDFFYAGERVQHKMYKVKDGKVVWELSSWNEPADLGPSTTIRLLDDPVNRKKMRFGEFK